MFKSDKWSYFITEYILSDRYLMHTFISYGRFFLFSHSNVLEDFSVLQDKVSL